MCQGSFFPLRSIFVNDQTHNKWFVAESPGLARMASSDSWEFTSSFFFSLYFKMSATFCDSVTVQADELICIYLWRSHHPLSSLGPLDASVCLTEAAHQYWQLPSLWVASMVCAAPVRQTHSAILQYLEQYENHLSGN